MTGYDMDSKAARNAERRAGGTPARHDEGLSRRDILRRAGAFGVALSLAGVASACDGAKSTPSRGAGAGGKLQGELNIIAWSQQWEFAVKPFERETGVRVNMTFQDSDIDSIQKARQSPGKFDVISYGPNNTAALEARVFQELDLDRLNHWKELASPLREAVTRLGQGRAYNLPYYYGGTILARDTKLAPAPINSWSALWDPAYKGKAAYIDDPTDSYFAIWLQAGLDPADFSDASFDRARSTAIELIKNLKTFWSSGTDIQELLARGEVAVTAIWDGTARSLIKEGESVEGVIPTEGMRGWIDGPGILSDAPNPNAAYAWLNFVSRPEIGAQLGKEFSFTPANIKAFDHLDAETQELLQAKQMEELFASGKFQFISFTSDVTQKLNRWWTDVKLGAGT